MTLYDPYSAVAPPLPFALAPQRRPLATIMGKFPLTVLTLEEWHPEGSRDESIRICEYYGPCQPTRYFGYPTYLDALNALILWLNRPGRAPKGWHYALDYDSEGRLVEKDIDEDIDL